MIGPLMLKFTLVESLKRLRFAGVLKDPVGS